MNIVVDCQTGGVSRAELTELDIDAIKKRRDDYEKEESAIEKRREALRSKINAFRAKNPELVDIVESILELKGV